MGSKMEPFRRLFFFTLYHRGLPEYMIVSETKYSPLGIYMINDDALDAGVDMLHPNLSISFSTKS
jgi:hypothetical protein